MTLDIRRQQWLMDSGRYDEVWVEVEAVLRQDPYNRDALFLIGQTELRRGNKGAAFQYFMRSEMETRKQSLEPRAETYNNIGCCLHDEQFMEDAKLWFLKSYEMDNKSIATMANLCAVEAALGQPEVSVAWADKVLEIDDANPDALYNSSLSMFALGRWSEAWDRYKTSIGNEFRTMRNYHEGQETPRWSGSADERVVIYGEQGLGDEILFASMMPDAIATGASIYLETQPALRRLFARSFPGATVYGTRKRSDLSWPLDEKIEARMEIGGLGEFFRQRPEDCPKTPYLTPDEQQRKMWRRVFGKKKPTIGLAWTGGSTRTGRRYRSLNLEALKPILESVNANFVSLEYLEDEEEMANAEIKNLVSFPWATQDCDDYDITASLVAELDLVVAVTTTVVDLAGALGTPCWVICPKHAPWRYGLKDNEMFWYPHRLFRQDEQFEWEPVLERLHEALLERFNK